MTRHVMRALLKYAHLCKGLCSTPSGKDAFPIWWRCKHCWDHGNLEGVELNCHIHLSPVCHTTYTRATCAGPGRHMLTLAHLVTWAYSHLTPGSAYGQLCEPRQIICPSNPHILKQEDKNLLSRGWRDEFEEKVPAAKPDIPQDPRGRRREQPQR